MFNRLNGHHAFAILLWLVAATLCILAARAPLANLAVGGPPNDLFVASPLRITPPRLQSSPAMTPLAATGTDTEPCLALTSRQLQPADASVSAALRLAFPESLRGSIVDPVGSPVYDGDPASPLKRVKPEYAETPISMNLFDTFSSKTAHVAMPLKAIFDDIPFNPQAAANCQQWAQTPYAEPVYDVSLQTIGRPDLYPNDWYATRTTIWFSLPYGLTSYRPQYFLGAGTGMATYAILAGENSEDSTLSLLFQRETTDVAYIYAIASVPLGLLLILIHLLFFPSKTEYREIGPFLLGVAAAMLAVLPLRQVLVPSDIPGITRLDMYLGIQLVLIVCVALVGYGWYLWRQPAAPANPEKRS